MEGSLPCRSLCQGGYCRPGEVRLEPKPTGAPPMLTWESLVGQVLSRKSFRRGPKSLGDVVHIGAYRGSFVAAWAMQALK